MCLGTQPKNQIQTPSAEQADHSIPVAGQVKGGLSLPSRPHSQHRTASSHPPLSHGTPKPPTKYHRIDPTQFALFLVPTRCLTCHDQIDF
jgi:hypothetical protein